MKEQIVGAIIESDGASSQLITRNRMATPKRYVTESPIIGLMVKSRCAGCCHR